MILARIIGKLRSRWGRGEAKNVKFKCVPDGYHIKYSIEGTIYRLEFYSENL